jgi:hypothetical protein
MDPAPRLALGLALAAALGCAQAPVTPPPPPAVRFDPAQASPALAPAVARADAAVKALRERLTRRLVEALPDAPAAVAVCRDEAPAIAAEVVAETGVAVGRTSHRLRSPGNAPPAWARADVAAAAGRTAAEVAPVAYDLGDRVALLRPIPTGAACLKCHGPAEGFSPGVRAAISQAYPQDRATGFAEGELRGFFWAEVPR